MSLPSGALLGSQTPRVARCPDYDFSHVDDAVFLAGSVGIIPDPWQVDILRAWLGERGGRWAATRCGCSVPRQNGKNVGVLEVAELYKIVALGRRVLHTAHEVKTTRKTFLRFEELFTDSRQRPELAELVKTVRRTNGQEAIFLHNGGSIEFVARSKGSGRGFTVDDLVCDEAQELTEDQLAALLPTISAAPSGNPQTTFTGTPPAPSMDGEAFIRMRSAGLAGDDPGLAWTEFSVPSGEVDTADRGLWAGTNPALGRRLLLSTVADEHASMGADTFARERLGQWPDASAAGSVVDLQAWADLAVEAAPGGKAAFAFDMPPNRSMLSLGAAVRHPDERIHVEAVLHTPASGGLDWVADWFASRKADTLAVVVDGKSPAMSLVPGLRRAGVRVTITGVQAMAQACGGFVDDVRDAVLTHFDQEPVNFALRNARQRALNDAGGWGWDRRSADVDISPLVAVTLARHGLIVSAPKRRVSGATGGVVVSGAGGGAKQSGSDGWQQVEGAGHAPYRIRAKT